MTVEQKAACIAYAKTAAALSAIISLLPDDVGPADLRHDGTETSPECLLATALLMVLDAKGHSGELSDALFDFVMGDVLVEC